MPRLAAPTGFNMIGALIIVFREVIEAGLIVGIVLAATRGVPGRTLWVVIGLVAGLVGAGIVAASASLISDLFEGTGQELLNASVLIVAVLMLTWHNVWMASHGRELAAELRGVGNEVRKGERSLAALAVVIGVAVLREGSEVVLFLYGIVAGGASVASLMLGGVLGLVGGAIVSAISYAGLVAIPARYIFRVTTALIAFLSAGMAAQAVQFLNAAGTVTILERPLWNTSKILPEDGMAGRVLHTLVGYTDRPTELQLIVYVGVLLATWALVRYASSTSRPQVAVAGGRA
jgi:high-affinity iron transporter